MRVCLISREYPPLTDYGGIATFSRHLVTGLLELGHEVDVLSLGFDRDSVQEDSGDYQKEKRDRPAVFGENVIHSLVRFSDKKPEEAVKMFQHIKIDINNAS